MSYFAYNFILEKVSLMLFRWVGRKRQQFGRVKARNKKNSIGFCHHTSALNKQNTTKNHALWKSPVAKTIKISWLPQTCSFILFNLFYLPCRATLLHLWLELELGAQDAQLNLVCNFICTRSELQCVSLLGLGSTSVYVLSLCTISNYCNYNALETVGSVGIAFHWHRVKSYYDIFRLISTLAIFNQVSELMTKHFFLIKYTHTRSIRWSF